jgi:Protein of unknown function (DUF3172)
MVVDERVFITFNPFSIYVAQADVKPGCVLRQSNFAQVRVCNCLNCHT